MKALESTKFNYIVEESLEDLHSQSIQWLEEVEFWKDENVFFYNLLSQKAEKSESDWLLQDELITLSTLSLKQLKEDILAHERNLGDSLRQAMPDMQHYRSVHRELTEVIMQFERDFKELKRRVFLEATKSS